MYAPVSEADAVRVAQRRAQRHAVCNTVLLAVSALCLAVILGRGGDGDGARQAPSLATEVPGLPRVAFTDPGGDPEDWESMGEGPMPLWYDLRTGRVWANVQGSLDQDMLVVEQVTQGVGVRGLWDAGSIITQRLVNFRREGPKILLVAVETVHRSSDPGVTSSVEQSFANSVMWTFAAQEDEDGLYIDLTPYVLRDSEGSGLIGSLRSRGGDYYVDQARSVINKGKVKSRALFSCVETNLTYVDPSGGARGLSRSLPDASAITVALRRSFVQLPPLEGPEAFTPRPFLPKSGYGQVAYTDEAAPLLETRIKVYIRRHAIGGVTPGRSRQAGGAGITYYLDNGTPSYIAEAILEGINWWDQAFQSAGFPAGTFRAELQPDDVDLFDFDRTFNAVQWVHRDHRSWSVGSSVADPRTGEIIKGHVRLGSLRGRQDALIGLGLIQPYRHAAEGSRRAGELFSEIEGAVLQRHRQLGAHEVGHTLGLAHNYMGSTYTGCPEFTSHLGGQGCDATVMDYPAPMVELSNGEILETAAYAQHIGEWDKVMIEYGYQELPRSAQGSDAAALSYLQRVISDAETQRGYVFLSDQDNGGRGGPDSSGGIRGLDWRSSQWDNGMDPAEALEHALDVRQTALATLDERSLQPYDPYSKLRDVLPPVWLWHRYEVEVAAKALGGVEFQHVVKGEPNAAEGRATPTAAPLQWGSLDALLRAVTPETLSMSPALSDAILPPAFGYTFDPDTDWLEGRMGDLFDPLGAAEIAAGVVFSYLLEGERVTRINAQNPTGGSITDRTQLPSLRVYLSTITAGALPRTGVPCQEGAASQLPVLIANLYADRLIKLHLAATHRVRSMIATNVGEVVAMVTAHAATCSPATAAEWTAIADALTAGKPIITDADHLTVPAGAPI